VSEEALKGRRMWNYGTVAFRGLLPLSSKDDGEDMKWATTVATFDISASDYLARLIFHRS
jgi:hypothetical protein